MHFKIPFSGRAHRYTDSEVQTVVEVMQIAQPLTQGHYQKQFQEKFSKYTGAKHAFALNNATAALELTAQLCRFKQGDEVIIPAHTFTASAYPFLKQGVKIVWADIDSTTHVVTPETIASCINNNTKAIVVVHLYGYGAEMPEIKKLAERHNLIVIEDAAQSLGVEIDGQQVGTFGDYGIFSFHSHKNISTLGEGGMLTIKDEQIAKLIPMLRHNGHCSFDDKREYYWIPAMGNVDLPEIEGDSLWPNNYCLGEVECALGVKLLDRIDQINADKRTRALQFIDSLADYPEIKFHRIKSKRHNYHLLVAEFDKGLRNLFIQKMAENEQIQCVVQYYPLYRYDFYKKAGQDVAHCPNTDRFFDNMVSFPFHQMLSSADLEQMLSSTKRVLEQLRFQC
jgi:dTDP-4-amino-4,6-dideoxygalactose transaminase|tara:strand:- start:22686 stop:23870 length:1185 start_codon:yes stop_codon:yes gene_type:complete